MVKKFENRFTYAKVIMKHEVFFFLLTVNIKDYEEN